MADAWGRRPVVAVTLAIEIVLAGVAIGAARATTPDLGPDYVAIKNVTPAPAAPATFSYAWDCGHNEAGHRNTANIVVTPGRPGPPHHVHEYVGNLAVGVASTVDDLSGGPTTCRNGDRSTYYWPVLRTDTVQVPTSVTLTFYGNSRSPVVQMPRLLRGTVGDARAFTNGGARASPVWSCSGEERRRSLRYPICRTGERVLRIFDFPSCWDGRRVDAPDHRAQLIQPQPGGGCPESTFAVPRLEIVVAYALPRGTPYRIDSFDDERHSPRTDHAFFVNLMPDALMNAVVECLNTGRGCQ
ncbi:DUF1996 domain-containing protein [Actinoplanes sp. NPDC049548]|uniref:DUF1996 domain-containing protein n=1 Tax=Actinoplanes sp. NPDC049548 TaxID=3155152 RepID=UPI00342EE08B